MTIRMETERLILRDIDPEADFEAWADCFSDADTMRFIGGDAQCRAAAWRTMATMIGHQQIHGYSFYSVIEKSSGNWIGRVGHWFPDGWPEPEIGWVTHRDHCRKGFAKEAAAACIDYAFEELGWDKVIHVIAEENIGSIKTAEAIGSKRLYHVPNLPPYGDVNCWAYGQDKP